MKTTQLTATLIAIGTTLSARAATIFSEDFESYAPGSNLVGQGGWTDGTPGGGSEVTIGSGTFLPSQLANGRGSTASFRIHTADHLVTMDPLGITTLNFTAYATSVAPISHSTGIGLIDLGGGPGGYWQPQAFNGALRWVFSGENNVFVLGGYDQIVEMGVVVDGIANEIFGTYNFGGGPVETPHYCVSDAQIAALDAIRLDVDHREPSSYTGMEIDNISVSFTPVPEPSTWALGGMGLAGLWFVRRRKA